MRVLILLTLSLLTSCTSVMTRSKMSAEARYKENFIFYTGTRLNYEVLTNDSEKKIFMRYLLGIPDLPLSMIVDTVLVPLDFVVYSAEKSKEKQSKLSLEMIKKSVEQMIESLSKDSVDIFVSEKVDPDEVQTSLFDLNLRKLDQESKLAVTQTLKEFLKDDFKKTSYERGGRHYFKGQEYLLSFRSVKGKWRLSTLSRGIDLE